MSAKKTRRSGNPKVRASAGRTTPKGASPSGGGAVLRAETPSRVTPPGTLPRSQPGANKIRNHSARSRGHRPAPVRRSPLMAVSPGAWVSEEQRNRVLRGVAEALANVPDEFR